MELILSLAAIGLIIFLGRKGASAGFFKQVVTVGTAVLAMFIALRYWYPVSIGLETLVGHDSGALAFGAFWVLFLLVFAPLSGLAYALNDRVLPTYPMPIERAFGFILGCLFGAILACCIVTSVLFYIPKVWPGYDSSRLMLPLDRAPVSAYRLATHAAERSGLSADEKAVFPRLKATKPGELTAEWN